MVVGIILLILYITFTIWVHYRINCSDYLDEERRKIHKWLVWILPFLGPLLIKGFWLPKKKSKPEVVTRERKDPDPIIYGSIGSVGIGLSDHVGNGDGGADGGGGISDGGGFGIGGGAGGGGGDGGN